MCSVNFEQGRGFVTQSYEHSLPSHNSDLPVFLHGISQTCRDSLPVDADILQGSSAWGLELGPTPHITGRFFTRPTRRPKESSIYTGEKTVSNNVCKNAQPFKK